MKIYLLDLDSLEYSTHSVKQFIELFNVEESLSNDTRVFTNLKKLKKFLKTNSLALSLIYTTGHMIIAGTTVYIMTGATIWEAGAVALVEPALNGIWFYVLHSLWRKFN